MAKKKSYRGKKQYGLYKTEGRFLKNKTERLKAVLKKQPKNLQVQEALKKIEKSEMEDYKRKSSRHNFWKPASKSLAQILTFLGFNGDLALIPKPMGDKATNEAYGLAWSKARIKAEQKKPGFFGKLKPRNNILDIPVIA